LKGTKNEDLKYGIIFIITGSYSPSLLMSAHRNKNQELDKLKNNHNNEQKDI